MNAIRFAQIAACMLALHASANASSSDDPDLLLAGGALQTCSSVASDNCADSVEWPADAFRERRFELSAGSLARLREHAPWAADGPGARVLDRLTAALASGGERSLNRRRLPDLVNQGDDAGEPLLDRLTDREYHALLDLLEHWPITPDGEPQREAVALERTADPDGPAIYRRFVAMAKARAGGARPLVVVTTAASRDPFEAVDFYRQVFEQAGARTVWLPMDAALVAARAAGDCDGLETHRREVLGAYQRHRVRPDLAERQGAFCRDAGAALSLLREAHGVFFNGGDQSLTRRAFIGPDGQPAAELELIRERFRAGDLAVGGTSAGTAVQSGGDGVPMISNGSPERALADGPVARDQPPPRGCGSVERCGGVPPDALTYHPRGGLGLFSWGVLDTHLSERRRSLRLAALLDAKAARAGYGVDETTALLVSATGPDPGAALEVIGRGGVWVATGPGPGLTTHYLPSGTTWRLRTETPPKTARPVASRANETCRDTLAPSPDETLPSAITTWLRDGRCPVAELESAGTIVTWRMDDGTSLLPPAGYWGVTMRIERKGQ